jgi:hypothetical protein
MLLGLSTAIDLFDIQPGFASILTGVYQVANANARALSESPTTQPRMGKRTNSYCSFELFVFF